MKLTLQPDGAWMPILCWKSAEADTRVHGRHFSCSDCRILNFHFGVLKNDVPLSSTLSARFAMSRFTQNSADMDSNKYKNLEVFLRASIFCMDRTV